jgi:hypothetical protein
LRPTEPSALSWNASTLAARVHFDETKRAALRLKSCNKSRTNKEKNLVHS